MKVLLPVALVFTLLAGCDPDVASSPASPVPTSDRGALSSPPQPQATEAVLSSLPGDCQRWRGIPKSPEITFVKRGRLFALDPRDGSARCIGHATSHHLEWGPHGDRLLLTSGASSAYGDGFRQELPSDQRETTWSRPTGSSVVYVSHDYAALRKEDVASGAVTDISFLDAHFDVAYHPAGTHIAVAGTAGGAAGLFLATNEGTEVQQIVRDEDAEYIDGLAFSHDGRHLYFRATHENTFDLHSVRIFTGEETADTERHLLALQLRTIYSGARAPEWSTSPFTRKQRILYSTRCLPGRGQASVVVGSREISIDPDLGSVEPVGWLPDGSVALLAFGDARCDDFGEGDIYLWRDGDSTLLVEDVDAAAIRARLPAAPDPPAKAQGVVA